MHGNILNKNKLKLFNTANSDLAGRISILENNVYKITYYEIISGASGTITIPTAATINSNEFSGANCVLSEIDVNNKPTWVSPKDAGGTVVTATLNTSTGAWLKSGVTVSANVALIYSLNIRAADYFNLTNFYIIDEVVIGDFSYVLNNTTNNSVLSSLLASAMSDETGSGALVFGTSPTFTTDITTPLIIGGSAVGSTIQYKGTSGVGTSTVAAHQFLVGNNGATTAASIYNSGQISIGNYASPTNLRLVTIGQDTSYISLGSRADSTGVAAIYMNIASPSGVANNATLSATANTTVLNAGTNVIISNGGVTSATFGLNTVVFAPSALAGKTTSFTFTCPAHTNQTASTESENFKVTGNTKTWLAGAITTQRWNYFTANTAAFASASTIAESFGMYVEAATAGTNATITNNFALGLTAGTATLKFGHVTGDTTTAAIYLNQSTPSNTNYSIYATATTTALNGASTGVALWVGGSERILAYGLRTSGSASNFNFTTSNNTGMTASTEIPGYLYNSYSRQWATGAITTQREHYLKTVTYSFVGASTITNAYGLYVEAATAGTNATITNNFALGLSGSLQLSNNTTISGIDSAGTNRPLITWSSSDNITITGRAGTSDVVINPTSGGIGLYVKSNGDGSIGVASPSARWHIVKTTEQLRVGYDTSNYFSTTVSSVGDTTMNLVGTGSKLLNITANTSIGLRITNNSVITAYLGSDGSGAYFGSLTAHDVYLYRGNSLKLTITSSSFLFADSYNLQFNTTNGTKIGTATTQKLAFWSATPIVQPTTSVTAATFVANTSGIANDTATFDGYTIGQVVNALRNTGLLA